LFILYNSIIIHISSLMIDENSNMYI